VDLKRVRGKEGILFRLAEAALLAPLLAAQQRRVPAGDGQHRLAAPLRTTAREGSLLRVASSSGDAPKAPGRRSPGRGDDHVRARADLAAPD
jgi:hypothetical protein